MNFKDKLPPNQFSMINRIIKLYLDKFVQIMTFRIPLHIQLNTIQFP